MAAPWDISGGVYASKSMSSSGDSTPTALAFSADGTKAYILGDTGNTVDQYTLSTAWDVSTGSAASKTMSVSQDSIPYSLAFSSDGTKAYMGGHNRRIYQYSLSTAWDVSTGSYAASNKYLGSEVVSVIAGLAFSADGTKAYALSGGDDTTYQYSLSTAWDVSTLTYASKSLGLSSEGTSMEDLAFSADGTKVFVVDRGTDNISRYSLGTAWDVSTGSYDNMDLSVASEDTAAFGLAFSADGTKAYIAGNTTNTVYQYTLTVPYSLTGTVIDPSGAAIANADVQIFETNAAEYVFAGTATADGSGVYTGTAYTLTASPTFVVYASTAGPPRRFGATDNNLTAT